MSRGEATDWSCWIFLFHHIPHCTVGRVILEPIFFSWSCYAHRMHDIMCVLLVRLGKILSYPRPFWFEALLRTCRTVLLNCCGRGSAKTPAQRRLWVCDVSAYAVQAVWLASVVRSAWQRSRHMNFTRTGAWD